MRRERNVPANMGAIDVEIEWLASRSAKFVVWSPVQLPKLGNDFSFKIASSSRGLQISSN